MARASRFLTFLAVAARLQREIREIKSQVLAKRQTRSGTTWPSFRLNCRLLFITSTQKSGFMQVLSIRIVLDSFCLLIFYSEKFLTWIWRLSFAVNVTVDLSSASSACFVEDANTRQRLSFSFPELWYSLLEFNCRKNCQHLTNWMSWNKRDEVWSSGNSLFKWRFRWRRRRCC